MIVAALMVATAVALGVALFATFRGYPPGPPLVVAVACFVVAVLVGTHG
jgi:hypothetical protein